MRETEKENRETERQGVGGTEEERDFSLFYSIRRVILALEIAAVIKMEYSYGVHHHLLLGSMCVRVFEREREMLRIVPLS